MYFCVLEALQNIQKYAQASHVTVRLRGQANRITFAVVDDGLGFDVASMKRGAGLTNMADRLDALGGALRHHLITRRGDDDQWVAGAGRRTGGLDAGL